MVAGLEKAVGVSDWFGLDPISKSSVSSLQSLQSLSCLWSDLYAGWFRSADGEENVAERSESKN